MFAYSSVGQIGYIILGLSFDSVSGLTAAIVHLFNHGVTKGAIFMLLGCVALAWAAPAWRACRAWAGSCRWTSVGIVLAGLSLIGVPGTAGFVSKWYLVLAALENGTVVAGVPDRGVVAAGADLRLALRRGGLLPRAAPGHPAGAGAAVDAGSHRAVAGAAVYFGLDTTFTVGSAVRAAAMLLGGPR